MKNKKLYASKGWVNVDVQVANGNKVPKKKPTIFVNFSFVATRSMTNFEASKTLFQFLKIENCPHKHWSDTTNWTIAKATIKLVVQVS